MSFETKTELVEKSLHRYGLGVLFAANVFGAGSVYILSDTGANFAFALLWVLPVAFIVDIAMHDMSARLAVKDKPLAEYLTERLPFGGPIVISMALMSGLWATANYAVTGAALAWLIPWFDNVLIGLVLAAGAGIALVQLKLYDRIEAAVTAMVMAIFGSYGLLLFGVDVPWQSVATGLVPAVTSDVGYLTAVIAMIGTTVYWPNFFIQSSINPTKQWDDLSRYRKDNAFGILVTLTVGTFVLIISAITLTEGEMTLTGPGQPLVDSIGPEAMIVFVIAALLASFTSGTGTLFGAGFMIPQARGVHTVFGDRSFRRTVIGLIIGAVALSMVMLTYTGFTPVRLAITMPAVNGAIGLPLTAFGMVAAINKYTDVSLKANVAFVLASAFLLIGSLLTAQSLYETILSFL